jgi:large-conductance mechanosensitive channel
MQEENRREQQERDERSIGELFAELSQKTTTLVRQEIQLAKVEMSQKASRAGKNVGFLVVGGVVAYTGVLALVTAGIIVLGQLIPYWLSAAIIGFVIAAVGVVLVVKGANTLRQEEPTPRETVETLQEDKEWLKDQTS